MLYRKINADVAAGGVDGGTIEGEGVGGLIVGVSAVALTEGNIIANGDSGAVDLYIFIGYGGGIRQGGGGE